MAKSLKNNRLYCLNYIFYLKKWLHRILKSACPVIFIIFLIFPINSFSQSSTQNLSNVVQVSGGLLHLCALISTNGYLDENARGIVKCWGNNGDGQLGRGSTMFSGVPKEVLIDGTPNVLSNVKQISAGEYHNCAVVEKDTEDQIWCWGVNSDWSPVLGNNGNTDKSKAVKAIFSESHRFKKVVSGSYHTCAITDDGYLYCWGQDGYGCLGNSSVGSSSRVPVLSNISDVVDVALCRYNTTCALKSDTNIYCWGNGLYGLLGDGIDSQHSSSTPQLATVLGSGYTKVFGHSSALSLHFLKSDNTLKGLGVNSFNNVSNVVEIDSQYWSYNMLLGTSGAVSINGKGYLSNIKTIGMTQAATYCAVTEAGFIYCWGNNTVGQLGTGEYATSPYPVEVLLPESFYTNLGVPKMIRAGGEHSLVVTLENGVNKVVVFGNSNTDSYLPAYLKGIGGSGEFSGVIKKASSQCSTITENGIDRVICFGNGTNGFLGDGTTTSKTYPVYVKGVNGESEKLEGTLSGGVILSDGGKVALWGHNGYGQLGNQEYGIRNGTNEQGTTVLSDRYSSVPVLVQDRDSYLDAENPLTGAVEAVKSSYFTCAIMQDSTVKCWGKGGKYLGNQTDSNSTVGSLRPVTVIVDNDETPLSGVTQLTIQGGVIVYALKSDGSVVRWGTGISKRPVAFSSLSSGVKKIASGGSHTCAIVTENGRDILKCWGSNDSGQLGDKTFTKRTTPVTVVGVNGDTDKLINVTDVGCGGSHTCAIANDKVYCWGNAEYGKTGVKDYSVSTPTLLPALYEISGTVYVADGVTPMAGALVYAGKLGSVTTGSSGTYSITVPYGNEYEISVNKTDLSFKVQGEEVSTLSGTMASSNQVVSFVAQGLCVDGGTAGVDCVTCRDDLDCVANFHCENNGLVTSSCVADPPPCSSNALFDSIGNVCTSGLGVCKRTGTYYCSGISYTSEVECSATPKWSAVTTEICDTLDNDCDGEVDEDYVCDIDRDGVPNSEDKCPNLDDKATFTYTGENEVYYGNTYRNDEDMDEDGVVNCQDECVDDLPEEDLFLDFSLDFHIKTGCEVTPKGGITPTVTPTITSTFTASNTFTNTNTPTITPTSTKTFTETFTKTSTPTIAFTKTNTVTNTFTNTNTPTITDTFTSTFTLSNTITKTLTPTFTNTVTPEKLKIVTPETRLKKPVEVKRVKNHVRMKFEAFDGASLDDLLAKDLNINYQYLIHIRKLKRLGNKDKNYQYGRKKLSLQKSNIKTFKNLDKGIYSVRYRIVIKKNNITRKTKWSGRNLIVF